MKTIEQIKDLMVGKSVISDLADLLRVNDADFAESEKGYYAVSVQFITENSGSGTHLFLIFVLDGCSGKSKEKSFRECTLDCQQHITKGRTVTFIDNEHNPIRCNRRQNL